MLRSADSAPPVSSSWPTRSNSIKPTTRFSPSWSAFNALLGDRQWDEAVEILRQLAESSEGKLLAVTNRRYVGVGDWCQLRLAALPPEALKRYRGRIDPLAKRWYDEGLAGRNRALLRNVVQQAFASSYGDRALMALGELALESADYAEARWCWQRIVPTENKEAERLFQNGPEAAAPKTYPPLFSTWPGYPDTHLDLAAVRALGSRVDSRRLCRSGAGRAGATGAAAPRRARAVGRP